MIITFTALEKCGGGQKQPQSEQDLPTEGQEAHLHQEVHIHQEKS